MIINRLKPVVVVLAGALGALALAAFGSDSADPATAVPAAATTVPPAATAVPTTAPTDTVAAHYNACASNGSGHECARPNGSANGGTHSNSGAGHRLLGVRIYPQPRLGSRCAVNRVLRVCTQRNSRTGQFRLQRGYRWSRLESVKFQGSAGICGCFVLRHTGGPAWNQL